MDEISENHGFQEKILFIKDLRPKDNVRTTLLVKQKELFVAKNGKPYLSLLLGDRSGEIDTRIWERAEALAPQFEEGDVVAISGRVNSFQSRLQLVVDDLVPVSASEVTLSHYLPAGPENLEELYANLKKTFEGLPNQWVSQLGLLLLNDPDIEKRYKICPAAKTIHHAFLGGLLCHSTQLIHLIDLVLSLYEGIDRSLMIFGAAFHDFGKIYELSYDGKFGYTDEGKLVGHIAIGISLVDRKIQLLPGFPTKLEWQLKHLILSHHGKLEFGSPKRPATIEAQLLHHLDDMDSKIESIQRLLKSERNGSNWSAYHRAYDQYYYHPEILTQTDT